MMMTDTVANIAKNYKSVVRLIPLVILLFSNLATAEGQIQAGQEKSAICHTCHNQRFQDHPNLNGQHDMFMIKALQNFRSKFWFSPTMSSNAANLSNLAIYFSPTNKLNQRILYERKILYEWH